MRRLVCTLAACVVLSTHASAQQADPNSPTLVLLNGKVVTLDPQSRMAEAIAIRDGKILAVGDSASIKASAGKSTEVIDLAEAR